jgi:hypothetical protein
MTKYSEYVRNYLATRNLTKKPKPRDEKDEKDKKKEG